MLAVRRDGKKVTWEDTNTSAGQRQVAMLAFYEALRRLAKLVPPLVVDTRWAVSTKRCGQLLGPALSERASVHHLSTNSELGS